MIVVVLSNLFNLSCVRPVACSLWGGNSTRSKFNVDSDSGNVYYRRDGLCFRTGDGRGGVGVLMVDIVLDACVVCLERNYCTVCVCVVMNIGCWMGFFSVVENCNTVSVRRFSIVGSGMMKIMKMGT